MKIDRVLVTTRTSTYYHRKRAYRRRNFHRNGLFLLVWSVVANVMDAIKGFGDRDLQQPQKGSFYLSWLLTSSDTVINRLLAASIAQSTLTHSV